MNDTDLSAFTDQQINNLFWAAYEMNAAAIKLLNAGLIRADQPIDVDGIFVRLLNEANLRDQVNEALKGAH